MSSQVVLPTAQHNRRVVSLLIAYDTLMDCQLLKGVFTRSRSYFRVVGCAVSVTEITRCMNSCEVDIALISESLQEGPLEGFRVLCKLRSSYPQTKFIVLLKSPDQDLVVDAFRAGARGVFCRMEPLNALCKCVSAVHEGQIWANSSQLGAVLDAFSSVAPLRLVNSRGKLLLTKREEDVVKLVVVGHTNREVADKLRLSEHTVSNYLFRIYEKLGISTRVELVLYSLRSRHD